MALLEASGIGKNFGDTKVLKDISLTLEQGEALAIIGSSGSGKTTLLRCLNFLERPDTGIIKVNGETMWDAADPATQRESEIRKKRLHFGLVFQNFNLFPQYTALQNVMLAGELLAKERPDYKANKKAIHAELEQQAQELLAQMGLSARAGHYPHQLSGGQQQRIALARALVISPDVLLMDEPLSNLDAKLRVEMRSVIRHTQKSVGITTVYVTHDQEEAMAISDRIAVMKDGVIQHVGTPRDIYQRPKNVFVATFIGRTNIVNAHVKDGIITFADGYHEHIDALDKAAEQDVRCSIRPEEFIICKDGTDGIHGTVQECTYLGLNTHYTIDTDQGDSVEIVEESSIGEGLKKGEKVLLKVKKEKINVFTKDGGTNLIRSDAYEKQ